MLFILHRIGLCRCRDNLSGIIIAVNRIGEGAGRGVCGQIELAGCFTYFCLFRIGNIQPISCELNYDIVIDSASIYCFKGNTIFWLTTLEA